MPDEPTEPVVPVVARTASSDLDPKDPTDQKVKKWVKRIAYITGSLSAIVLPLAFLFNDVKDSISSKTQRVDAKTTAGYEIMAKAVNEIQDILTKTNVWAKQVEADKLKHAQANKDLELRIIKLEAYVDILVQRNASVSYSRDDRISNPNAYAKKTPDPTPTSKLPDRPAKALPADINTAQQMTLP